ncbi:MAG TPA: DUF1798 family protein [Bacillota bacterium]|nr:DUF1798 family protein [Bacillota bacterium]
MRGLIQQTEQLKIELDTLKNMYETNAAPENRKDKSFFLKVKSETEPVYKLLTQWENNALEQIKKQNVTNVHPKQIVSTKENIELLLMHSYYIDVRRRRYMELHHSVHYVLNQLLRGLYKAANKP